MKEKSPEKGLKSEADESDAAQEASFSWWRPLKPGEKYDESELRARTAWLVASARGGDRSSAVYLLREIAGALRDGTPLNSEEASFLADALESAISKPMDATKALGLSKSTGRPRLSRGKSVDQMLAGYAVYKLVHDPISPVPLDDGQGADDGWDGVGAISRVLDARKRSGRPLTKDHVRRGYTRYNKMRLAHDAWAETLPDGPPGDPPATQ